MSWRGQGRSGRNNGPYPGRGPFSYLPPWQRPGWLYGRGACWWLYPQNLQPITPPNPATLPPASTQPVFPAVPLTPALPKEQEKQVLEQQLGFLEARLETIRKRLDELSK